MVSLKVIVFENTRIGPKMKLICLLVVVLFAVIVASRPQKSEDSESPKNETPEELTAGKN